MSTSLNKKNIFTLMVAHCAGMVDLVVLPIWIGVLVSHYHFNNQSAGMLVTLFLVGVTIASCLSSPWINKLNIRKWIFRGFIGATLAFIFCFYQNTIQVLSVLHFFGGLSVGVALSLTHGTVGKSENPHRLFALLGFALGIFSIVFMVSTTHIIQHNDGRYLFIILAVVMGVAAFIVYQFFPKNNLSHSSAICQIDRVKVKLSSFVWLIIFGIAFLSMTQALTISFFERVGSFRGFSQQQISTSLIIYTIACIVPAPLAVYLQKRINKFFVLCVGPLVQAISALCIYFTHDYVIYTIFGSCMVFTILFIHTFAFGLLAELDPTGRAVSATPAMLMSGSAIGPILGGVLAQFYGYEAIGCFAVILVILQITLFNIARIKLKNRSNAALITIPEFS